MARHRRANAVARSARFGSGDRSAGSVSVEFAITMSALIIGFFTLVIGAGRVMQQENDVRSAAHAGARAASLRDTIGDARDDVAAIVAQNLRESGVSCEASRADIVSSPADFTPGGAVTVRVECTARPVGVLGLPANLYFYEATEAIDLYRGEP